MCFTYGALLFYLLCQEDSESTEPLSVDGNSSDLEEQAEVEELDTPCLVLDGDIPQTPDQEMFLKQHFGNLSANNGPDGPVLTSERNECASISSRFLAMAQMPPPREDPGSSTCYLSDQEVSPDVNRSPFEYPTLNGIYAREQDVASPLKPIYQRKRKQPADVKMARIGPLFNSVVSSIRKTQSVHDIVHEVKMRPQTQTAAEKEQKAIHRRTLPATLMKTECQPLPFQSKDVKQPKGRSYMNPTTSSMAKISRSVSVGENLNIGETQETSNGSDVKSVCEAEVMTISGEAEKTQLPLKDSVIVKPVLQTSTISSSPKTFQSKNRAHLTLDIAKPLPDRPFLSFGRSRSSIEMESPRSPRSPGCSWKPRLSFADVTCKNDHEASRGYEKVQLEDSRHKKQSPEENVTINLIINEPIDTVDLSPEGFKPMHRGRASTIGHTPDHHPGLCPVETIRPRSPSLDAASTLDSAQAVSFEQCEMIASELQDSLRRALSLYRSVTTASPAANLDHGKMAGLLTETFGMVKRELDSLKDGNPEPAVHEDSSVPQEDCTEKLDPPLSRGPRQLGDDKTLALLQQYSELLLQAVEKRMDKKL